MPWIETCAMDQKIKFVAAVENGMYSFAEICRQFGISRKSGYVLLERYAREGVSGLEPRSSAPHTHLNATHPKMIEQLLEMKRRYPKLSAGKVLDRLRMDEVQGLPARSTVGDLFKRYGLIRARKARSRHAMQGTPLSYAGAPNALWSVDFKGQFRLGNARWCYPLTLSDNYSRYLLVCKGLEHPSERAVWPHMERAFREYGLPEAIRSDNGTPFASVGLGGLTRLSIWWLKLGVNIERICPGHPEQNPRHERLHRTLKADIDEPRYSLPAQQRRLNWFRHYYNVERPHDALGGVPPVYRYRPSGHAYPKRIAEPEYPVQFSVRQVRRNGQIKWQGHLLFVSEALVGEPIGLLPFAQDCWQVWFCSMNLGVLNMRTKKIDRPS